MIEVKNLVKKYGRKTAVKDMSFTVRDNEILGFLGPNGAGKSTAMNMITGYISMTSGTVCINGTDLCENPTEAKKNIGYLPEIPPLYPEMTVVEYLSFVCKIKKAGNTDGEVKRIAELTGTDSVLNRRIGNLSKGYRQRVGFAAALTGNPSVIVLDEPTVGMDPEQIREIRELIVELGKTHSVILSSHILSEISGVCDRVLIIKDGELVAEDTPKGLAQSLGNVAETIIKIDSDRDGAEKVLGSIPDIEYKALGNEEYNIKINGSYEDKIKEIFFAFADSGIAILELHRREASLEEIFIKLTGGEP